MQLSASWPGIVILVLLVSAIIGSAATAFVRLTDKNTAVDIGLLHGRIFGHGARAVTALAVLLFGLPV